jgi:hypothetical protein
MTGRGGEVEKALDRRKVDYLAGDSVAELVAQNRKGYSLWRKRKSKRK